MAKIYPLPRSSSRRGSGVTAFTGSRMSTSWASCDAKPGSEAADGRVVIAHLGNGSSLAAVRGGKMRRHDDGIDADRRARDEHADRRPRSGRPAFLLREKRHDGHRRRRAGDSACRSLGRFGNEFRHGRSAWPGKRPIPMRPMRSRFTVARRRNFWPRLPAVLGGLDTLIFTAGIGENAPAIRGRICQDLEFLGVHIDADRNAKSARRHLLGTKSRHRSRDENKRRADDRPAHATRFCRPPNDRTEVADDAANCILPCRDGILRRVEDSSPGRRVRWPADIELTLVSLGCTLWVILGGAATVAHGGSAPAQL